jgi:hypothetical protein
LLDGVEQLLRDAGGDPVAGAAVGAAGDSARGTAAGILGDDAPVVEPLLGRSRLRVPRTVPVPADSQQEQARLFAALLRVLGRVAGQAPLVVAVDDLHLAGPSTLAWLRFAARRGERLLVVGTARPPGAVPPERAEYLDLTPLDVAAVAQVVGPERAQVLWERSGGNPLLLLALAAGEGEGPLPGRRAGPRRRRAGRRDRHPHAGRVRRAGASG